MQKKAMFVHAVKRILQSENEVVIRNEINSDTISYQQGILKLVIQGGIRIKIVYKAHIKKGVQIKGVVHFAEFLRFNKIQIEVSSWQKGKLKIILEYAEVLTIYDIVLI
ncbi:MAG: hypothetical protein DRI97_17145, partial [Bacteroidetes bacterium]